MYKNIIIIISFYYFDQICKEFAEGGGHFQNTLTTGSTIITMIIEPTVPPRRHSCIIFRTSTVNDKRGQI